MLRRPRRDDFTSGASRRRLQSEQLASTTTHRPNPRAACRLDPPSSRWTGSEAPDEVEAPSVERTACQGEAWRPAASGLAHELALARSTGGGLLPGFRRGFTGQGLEGSRRPAPLVGLADALQRSGTSRAPCWSVPGDETLPQLDSLGHFLSRNRRAAGRSPGVVMGRPGRSRAVFPSDSAPRASLSRKSVRLALPPFEPLAQPARRARRSEQPAGPAKVRNVALARPARACPARSATQAARAVLPPGVEGRFLRGPAKSPGIRCTRSAFRRRAARWPTPGSRPGPPRLAWDCPQLLTSLWKTLGALSSTDHRAP